MVKKGKRIVILGAGFAGLQVAQRLPKLIGPQHSITLVDRYGAHLYTPDLYEIATAFHETVTEACLTELKETVATPISSLVDSKRVDFIQAEIQSIDPKRKRVKVGRGWIPYDYLIVALGSVPSFFNIPGLETHAYTLKTIRDALNVNCHLDQLFQKTHKRATLDLVVGGGGATGVELTAELSGYVEKLCKKYKVPRKNVSITLVEGGDKLAGMGRKGTNIVQKRFKERGIETELDHLITKVTPKEVVLKSVNGRIKKIPYSLLLWTGGVQVNPVIKSSLGDSEHRGAILVDTYLRSKAYSSVFAAGDNAYFTPLRSERPLAMLAQFAYQQGFVLAHNVAAALHQKPLKSYKPHPSIYLIPVGGKYGLGRVWKWIFTGFFPWYLHRLVSLRYSLSIMKPRRAWKKWRHGTDVFVRND